MWSKLKIKTIQWIKSRVWDAIDDWYSVFSNTRLPSELWRVLTCESPAVFQQTPLKEKGPWGPFYQLRQVLAKGRHLLQILLKALLIYKQPREESGLCCFSIARYLQKCVTQIYRPFVWRRHVCALLRGTNMASGKVAATEFCYRNEKLLL